MSDPATAMSDDVRADARRLLDKHADKADLWVDAPTSVQDIRDRLTRCTHGCRCDDGDHENAVHDLASSDVPVLLAAFEDALATLQQVRKLRDDYLADDNEHLNTFGQHHPIAGIAADHLTRILDGGAS